MADIGVFEAIHSARALRRLKPDPIPDELVTRVLDAAIRAPSGSNNQGWVFVVIKNPALRAKIGDIYRRGGEVYRRLMGSRARPAHLSEKSYARLQESAQYLFEHMGEAPVLLLVCHHRLAQNPPAGQQVAGARPPAMAARLAGASVYPAVQNIILACRALGLGTVLTTLHAHFEDEVKAALGLPPEIDTYALMPIGYPQEGYGHGPVRRRPLGDVAFLDRWGNSWSF